MDTVRIRQQDEKYDNMSCFVNFNLHQTGYYCDDHIEVNGMDTRVACVTG
jgi:hypothetical protein